MFLETTNRKGEKVAFATANDLYDSIFEMDTVTLGKTLSVLPVDGNERIWLTAYDAHHDKARVAPKLHSAVTNIMNRAVENGDEKLAKEAARRLDPFTDPDAWWASKQSDDGLDLTALNDETVGTEAIVTTAADVVTAPAETFAVRDRLDAIVDVDAKREALREKVKKAPKAPKEPSKPRVRAEDNGPRESLGKVIVETRSEGEVEVEDFYGDGQYIRRCVPCQNAYTYNEGFGWRVINGKKCVQPQCRACRRKASKAAVAKEKARSAK